MDFPLLSALLLPFATLHAGSILLLLLRWHTSSWFSTATAFASSAGGAFVAVGLFDVPWDLAAAGAGASVLVAVVSAALRGSLTWGGAVLWGSYLALLLAGVLTAALFFVSLDLSLVSSVLLWAAAAPALLVLPSFLVKTKENWEPLIRERWRSRRPAPSAARTEWPRVSVQVPCHAEPPEVVKATLDHLAALEYPNFEVVVVDNNTVDEALWRPLEAHCRKLGSRFKFLHVEGLAGAKAGALNWALPQVDPAAEILAVVDADYWVDPQWLKDTVGYFDDEKVGFVQCPHAYRDHESGTFLTWANWEYAGFFKTGMVSLDEHGAGITVGTMSLLRRSAFEEVGGWAEWCLTEDSELAIRLHAAGWTSVYLDEPYGWGLIPETFEGYRKQRFRWTYGPVQELYRHWRHFVPSWLGGSGSSLSWTQRLHHANHGVEVMVVGARMLSLFLAALTGVSMVLGGEHSEVPAALWLVSTIVLLGDWTLRFLTYRRVVSASWRQTLGSVVAAASLTHVMTVASWKAMTLRKSAWARTSKFKEESARFAALASARTEMLVALVLLAGAALFLGAGGVVAMFGAALALQSLQYLAAPVVAWVADRDLQRSAEQMVLEVEAAAAPSMAQLPAQRGHSSSAAPAASRSRK